ncbi:MAG: hypothetical protein U0L77_00875, partial [Prevotellamassilia sp.]|nr:hypothetical protein [Prevotellamassilia sp.]
IAQLVEHNLAKVGVASSSLVFRSKQCLVISDEVQSPKGLTFCFKTHPHARPLLLSSKKIIQAHNSL